MVEILRTVGFTRNRDIRHASGYVHNKSAVLEPFSRPVSFVVLKKTVLIAALLLFCFIYGASFALMAPFIVVPFLSILAILVLLVIWTLPGWEYAPTGLLDGLLFAFFATLVLWPNYLAIALPGLPWITPLRFVGLPLALTLLVCVSVSASFRSQLAAVLRTCPWQRDLVFAFVVLQVLSVFFSAEPGVSIDEMINAQANWTAVFVSAAVLLSKGQRLERMIIMQCAMAAVLSLIGIAEFRVGHVLWLGHIPSFLQINDPSVGLTLAGTKLWNGVYRIEVTYGNSLGLAEYFAVTYPFLIYFVLFADRTVARVGAGVGAALVLLGVTLTGARVGFVGVFVATVCYPLLWSFLKWRRGQANPFDASFVFLSPVVSLAAVASTIFVPAISYRFWGGGQAQYSTQARIDQLNMGIPKIITHPWGFGIGQGANALGYRSPGGLLTIDSYWLRTSLEYGVVGFLVFGGIFAASFFYLAKGALSERAENKTTALFAAIGTALLNFLVIRLAFAEEFNQPIMFLLFGMVSALTFRTMQRETRA